MEARVQLGARCEEEDSTLVALLQLFGAHDEDDGGFPLPTYLRKSEQRKGGEPFQRLAGTPMELKQRDPVRICLGRRVRDGVRGVTKALTM